MRVSSVPMSFSYIVKRRLSSLTFRSRKPRSYSKCSIAFLTTELDGINVTRLAPIGDPAHEIIRHATAEKVDLIMMPTHGHGPFSAIHPWLGDGKLLHDAPCPVWTSAHLETALPPAPQYFTNILCAIDLDERGVKTLRFAGKFASFTGAKLIVAHATPVMETSPDACLRAGAWFKGRQAFVACDLLLPCDTARCIDSQSV